MNALRVVFLGSDRWSVPSLEALAESEHDIVLVGTREAKPAGRGSKLTPTPVGSSAWPNNPAQQPRGLGRLSGWKAIVPPRSAAAPGSAL